MATTKYTIPAVSGYVKVTVGSGQFLIENITTGRARMVLATSQPAIGANGHKIDYEEAMSRFGDGDAYVKSDSATDPVVVLVTN